MHHADLWFANIFSFCGLFILTLLLVSFDAQKSYISLKTIYLFCTFSVTFRKSLTDLIKWRISQKFQNFSSHVYIFGTFWVHFYIQWKRNVQFHCFAHGYLTFFVEKTIFPHWVILEPLLTTICIYYGFISELFTLVHWPMSICILVLQWFDYCELIASFDKYI